MKYFGKRSLASFLTVFLDVMWYVLLIGGVLIAVAAVALLSFETTRTMIQGEIAKDMANWGAKQRHDWEGFMATPLFVKLLIVPWVIATFTLLLVIVKRARRVFAHFRDGRIFDQDNVNLIAGIAKLLVVFSVLTVDLSGFLTALFLLMGCEVFRRGIELKKEVDLTV